MEEIILSQFSDCDSQVETEGSHSSRPRPKALESSKGEFFSDKGFPTYLNLFGRPCPPVSCPCNRVFLSGADLCHASTRSGPHPNPAGEPYSEEHWGSLGGRSLGRHGGRDHVDAGLRHQPPLLLPQQRGAGCGEKPLETLEDGSDSWEEQHHSSKQSLHKRHLLRQSKERSPGRF